jgi:lipopolysaccharide transport system ATP-binding protein
MGETFWALEDVSFQVKEGEVLGIIGRNGAGKSTLLKILSQVTTPTSGQIKIKGRIASLLEVGTGFHPELTGRENVFLNGAILGMTKAEIRSKFDEIVAFSEIEEFIDTPVKRYSSGMYVRLAFAVAAHLEPEILICDEVLAVGDAEFQKKCMGKMKDVAGHGRTILFVSHNIASVRALCNKGVLLKNGKLEAAGSIENVIEAYADAGIQQTKNHTVTISKPSERCAVWMESVSILCNGNRKSTLEIGDKLSLEVKFRSYDPIQRPIIGYLIRSSRGEDLVNANNYFLPSSNYSNAVTEGTITCDLGDLPLMSGSYSVSFWLCRNPHEQHHVEDVLHFTVEEKNIWGTDALPNKSLGGLWWPTQFRFSVNQ